jgi:hypothetical protein
LKKSTIGALTGALVLVLVGVAVAAVREEHTATLRFTTGTPAASAGVAFDTDRRAYRAPGPGETANPVTRVTITLQPGTRINGTVVRDCNRAALQARGQSACRRSQLDTTRSGDGNAEAVTGISAIDPVRENVDVFDTRGGLLIYLTPKGAVGQTAIIPARVRGNRIIASVPRFCLPGDDPATPACDRGEAVLTDLDLLIRRISTGRGLRRRNYVTTPRCLTGTWRHTVAYLFRNGDTETERIRQRCRD